MKSTIVPAQVTTVEDKIVGNLNFTQLLLLTTPVFMSGVVYAFSPPFMGLATYKLILCASLALVCVILAVRVKGRILLSWIAVMGRYNLRPRRYIYDKNNGHLRNTPNGLADAAQENAVEAEVDAAPSLNPMAYPDLVRLEQAVIDPRANFQIKRTKKGGLRVHIQEIK